MTPIRDQRTPAEIQAAQVMRWHADWPWVALEDAVENAAAEGQARQTLCDQLGIPWWFVASQYRQHHTELPPALEER